ncbi:MAG: membrane dipeptidase [Clostridia bacterium]|nr:membrane dipeptidase [Clostridia bacterium]
MTLFDLHCDTPLELYRRQESLVNGNCHISLDRAQIYAPYGQIMAVWSDKALDDDTAYRQYHRISDALLRQIDAERSRVMICRTANDLHAAWENEKTAIFLAVEDARLLGGEIDRLPVLHARGVRFLTLTWGGASCIGGAHDTDCGLTAFGREVVEQCFATGIIPDLSHASDATFDDVIVIAQHQNKPVIATHSNARAVCPHRRNLTDAQFCAIRDLGGIVGISLCPPHLHENGDMASVEDVVQHIEHYLDLGGAHTVALGADLDGTSLPNGFGGIEDIAKIADALAQRGHSDDSIAQIFSGNVIRFLENNLHA